MKRPEGFDPSPPSIERPIAGRRLRWPGKTLFADPSAADPSAANPTASVPTVFVPTAAGPAPTDHAPTDHATAPRATIRRRLRGARSAAETGAAATDARSRRAVRSAARARRRYERGEVRRFTRRSRRRRVTAGVVSGIVVVMLGLVAIAVYSPLLALKTIQIEGTVRVDPSDILAAIDDQLETPLALVDMGELKRELAGFPLIRSYVTETIPPNTLVIHIVEREAIGALATGAGFNLVDPAGIVIERSGARPPGIPLIDTSAGNTAAFDAAVEVLIALPDSVLTQLDTITARTRDDVRLSLTGGGASIIWGSADDSATKARALAVALAQNYPGVTEYNVSAPGQLTFR